MSTSRLRRHLDVIGDGVDVYDFLRWALTGLLSFAILMPLIYAFAVSFWSSFELYAPPHLIPSSPTIRPWVLFLRDAGPYLMNSLLIAVGSSVLIISVAVPGAYAFARKEFAGRKMLFYLIVLIMLVPQVMIVVPTIQIIRWIGLYNTIPGIWLALMVGGMPIAVWILRDNFQKLPPNAEEAAQVYGCTQFGAFLRVILPLATPAIVAVAFLSFLSAWTEFLFSNMLTTSGGAQPVVVYLFSLMSPDAPIQWPYVMAGSFVVGIPPALFYLLAQRYLSESLEF